MLWEPLIVFRLVREVAALADRAQPLSVSQRRFDEAKKRSPPHACLPRAKHIAERLGLSWPDVLVVAHEPEERQPHLLGAKTRQPRADWLTEDGVRAALRLVAHRLGEETVTLAAYRVDRAKLIAADRRRWLHGGSLRMPSDDQIIVKIGSWDAALRLAGLQATSERGDGFGSVGRPAAPSITELLQVAYDFHGVQLTQEELVVFARANGIPYPRERKGRFGPAMREWKQKLRDEGLPAPNGPPPRDERPDYTNDVGAATALPGYRRQRRWDDAEECAEWVQRCIEGLAGNLITKDTYCDWKQEHADAPSLRTLEQHGGWLVVSSRARDRIMASMGIPAYLLNPAARANPAPSPANLAQASN